MSAIKYRWEHLEVGMLVRDLEEVPKETRRELELVVSESGRMLRDLWRLNATRTAGRHGKHYPKSIKHTVRGLTTEIKPDARMPQGGMAFEYGGPSIIRHPAPEGEGGSYGQRVGQTRPHLDMNRAADKVFPWFHRQVDDETEIRL